ncbi:hypothetical protein EDD37DRAFT_235301 [Exophiala viscosa]|uniref:uncharacterized protein n=1 Tax=Exophiala viscosa TaxID=2486360 RepID=UPI00219E4B5B|nr:hypothetical protein EDD37DRAFT_235301 [Exophiala viscosa]
MNLLVQQHSALTAGVLALYSNLLNGERWEGLPVMEVDGSPSVHCILERLGVITADEEFDETLGTVDNYENIQLLPIREIHVVPKTQKGTKSSNKSRQGGIPPLSATSSSSTVPKTSSSAWHDLDNKVSSIAHTSEVSSSPSGQGSQSLSPTFEATSCSTPSTDDPTSFAGGVFLSPTVPTTTLCDGLSQDQIISDPTTFAELHSSNLAAEGYVMNSIPAMPMGTKTVFENGYETYGAENFADATCGMAFYDRESMYGNGTAALPSTIPQDYSQWIPGVLL